MKKIYFIFLLTILVLGCSRQTNAPPKENTTPAIFSTGQVMSQVFSPVFSVGMHVSKVFVEEGDKVKKGDQLFASDNIRLFESPFEGIVTHLFVANRQIVLPGQEILRLQRTDKLYIESIIDEESLEFIKPKTPFNIHFVYMKNSKETTKGIVESVYPKNGNFFVKISFNKKNILPGQSVDIMFVVKK